MLTSNLITQSWLRQLQAWATDGSLLVAGVNALQLKPGRKTKQLERIVRRLAEGDPRDIPPIEVLSSQAMPSAAGAYARGSGTIYLNEGWVGTANEADINKVLTEEYGHHLDTLLNTHDTEGDEGEFFSYLLLGGEAIRNLVDLPGRASLSDHGTIKIKKEIIDVECASTNPDGSIQLDGSEGQYFGSRAADRIYGSPLNDSIWPGNGHDWVDASDGNDTVEEAIRKIRFMEETAMIIFMEEATMMLFTE